MELLDRLTRLDERVLGKAWDTTVSRGHWILVAVLYGTLAVAGVISVAAGVAQGWKLIATAATGAVAQYVRFGRRA